ncbi:MAG: SDR family oxidoreductase [Lachnospiraceae bacterium]|jgi:2-deoxy-D-gluconate 3-dehydrogenase|nr:SDR family oxidoreductase [Lachnospiraceae bacterium]
MEQWERILSVNLSAVFRFSQLAAKDMIAQGKGKIINIASMMSFFGSEMISAYTASKGGIAQLTKALSNEWASKGITVNAIAPGYVITKLTADMKEKSPENYREITNRIPMKRWGTPEDLEGIAVFLASGYADYISGAVIPVDGGYLGK